MKQAHTMTDAQLVRWLDKTRASISNRPLDATLASYRCQDLLDRYEELRQEAALNRTALWVVFCERRGFAIDHDGYDLFA